MRHPFRITALRGYLSWAALDGQNNGEIYEYKRRKTSVSARSCGRSPAPEHSSNTIRNYIPAIEAFAASFDPKETNITDRRIAFSVPSGHWLPWLITALLEQMHWFQHRPKFGSRLSACSSGAVRIERGLDYR